MSSDAFWRMFAKKEKHKVVKSEKHIPLKSLKLVKEERPSTPEHSHEAPPEHLQEIATEVVKKSRQSGGKRKRFEIKNDEFNQFMMLGVPVRVPKGLNLYPTQKLMIVRVLAALKNSQNMLGESPTGSGKTMALLSSTCAWLKQYNDQMAEAKKTCPIHGRESYIKAENEERKQEENGEHENERDLDIIEIKPEEDTIKKVDLFEKQFNDDFIPHEESAFFMKKDKSEVKEGPKKEQIESTTAECNCLPRVRIYYGTRTHKQIAQVVKEFSRLPYRNIIKHTILASRDQSCIHPTARRQADISQYCKEINAENGIGCIFKSAMRPRFEKSSTLRDHLRDNGTIVFDIEEVVETLATSFPQLCPYFCTNRILTQDADLIFCPFSYLVDPLIRNSSDVNLRNSIVILDEAHNIEDTCRETASFSFTEKEIHDSVLSLRLKRLAVDQELSKNNAESRLIDIPDRCILLTEFRGHLLYLENLLLEMLRWIRLVSVEAKAPVRGRTEGLRSSTLSSENLFLSLTNNENGVDLFTPPKTPKYDAISSSFGAVTKHNDSELQSMDQFKPSATAIICIEKWLYFQSYFGNEQYQSTYRMNISIEPIIVPGRWNTFDGNSSMSLSSFGSPVTRNTSSGPRNMQYKEDMSPWFEGLENNEDDWKDPSISQIGHQPISEGCKTTISLWCMSPAITFYDAFSESRSIILASGTLCPMDTLKTELGMEFKQQVEGDQVISKDNIFAAVLPIGPHGNRIQCTYRNTSNPESPFYSEVGSIVRYVCLNVPAGILCFLPSYRVLEQLRTSMQLNSSLQHIETKKRVLFEPRRSSELSAVMDEFDAAIANPTKFGPDVTGALMFAVFRGKVSEGIDFADDRARVVITVGIPYPNAMDDQVTAKKVYNDQNSKLKGILTGDEWYTTQAYRALNQALGRCLRHKNDWGAMLMIDERLERQTGNLLVGAASARISKWIRAQLKSYPSYKEFNSNFREFIERRNAVCKAKLEVSELIHVQ